MLRAKTEFNEVWTFGVASLRMLSRGAVTDGVTSFTTKKVMTFLVVAPFN